MKTKLIVVVGPTAVGKTALGIELAQKYNGEIISGDSQQVYRGLDIGTAKATREEQAAAVHHLLDVREVTESYSAYDFVVEATALIEMIDSRKRLPIIVGGTGLYIQSLLEGYHLGGEVDQVALLAYRAELEQLTDEALLDRVEQAGLVISQINRRRAIRGLELARFGKERVNHTPPYQTLIIGLTDEREQLYQRINQRVEKMVEEGLIEEARWLYDHHPQVQATRGIGYKEFFPYFEGQVDRETAVEELKKQTRRFAKRQLTWFRNRMGISFYPVGERASKEQIFRAVEEFLDD